MSYFVYLCFQVYNLSQNIQEDDLQHLQVGVISAPHRKQQQSCSSNICFLIIVLFFPLM